MIRKSETVAEPLNFGDSVVIVFVHDGMRAVLHKGKKCVQLLDPIPLFGEPETLER